MIHGQRAPVKPKNVILSSLFSTRNKGCRMPFDCPIRAFSRNCLNISTMLCRNIPVTFINTIARAISRYHARIVDEFAGIRMRVKSVQVGQQIPVTSGSHPPWNMRVIQGILGCNHYLYQKHRMREKKNEQFDNHVREVLAKGVWFLAAKSGRK